MSYSDLIILILLQMTLWQWRTEGGAGGAIRPGRHSEGGGKKGKRKKKKREKKKKRKKRKRKKREKENMGKACNYSKTKM